jgi:hypothetical protein
MGKSITDLSSITTVGLDLAKHVFQVLRGALLSPRRSGARSCWRFSLRCRRALLGLRRAAQRITIFAPFVWKPTAAGPRAVCRLSDDVAKLLVVGTTLEAGRVHYRVAQRTREPTSTCIFWESAKFWQCLSLKIKGFDASLAPASQFQYACRQKAGEPNGR